MNKESQERLYVSRRKRKGQKVGLGKKTKVVLVLQRDI